MSDQKPNAVETVGAKPDCPPAICSTAAPKIKHGFHIMLTKKQVKELQKVWDDHSENGGMIIMQPVLNWGPFTVKDAFANCAVLNKECGQEILVAIAKAQQQPNSIY
jgi:hypothetical protein